MTHSQCYTVTKPDSCKNVTKRKSCLRKRSSNSSCGSTNYGGDNEIDLLGMPCLPTIPQMVVCLNLPGSEEWSNHWADFNKKVKDFHQAMIDFNWKILEWYSLKAKQLDRFGMKSAYIGGSLVCGPQVTIIYTRTISQGDVTPEVKKLLPDPVKKEMIYLEKTAYKLCLLGKIFIFNGEKVMVIDFDRDSENCFYRNCLKFTLYEKNEKINVFEGYARVYGGLRSSFFLGGIGGLLVSLVTGYYDRPPMFSRACQQQSDGNIMWLIAKRYASSSVMYTLMERFLYIKLAKPKRYILSGTAGAICGVLIGLWDNCSPMTIICAATEFAIYAVVCNIFMSKHPGFSCSDEV